MGSRALPMCMLVATLAAPGVVRAEDGSAPHQARISLGLGVAALAASAGAWSMFGVGVRAARRAEHDYVSGPGRAERDAADRRGRIANGLVMAGALAGGALAVTGVVLIVRGARLRRAHMALSAAPGHLSLRVRF